MTSKGAQKERDFVNEWQDRGVRYDAFRLAASGGGSQSELPDVQFTNGSRVFVQEQKYAGRGQSSTNPVKYQEQQDLLEFAWRWGFYPLMVFRFAGDRTWYVVEFFTDLYYDELTESKYIYGKRSQRDRYGVLDEIMREER